MSKSTELYNKAKKIIPGGTQLFSKRPELFLPDYWPAYYSKSKGSKVWDLDDNCFIDMSYMGLGSCTLGYADEDVDSSVIHAIKSGNMTSLNVPEEVELAEMLCSTHPWASMVRYARTGGEAVAIAVRIARAFSGKDIILFGGYHGWHDWYLSSNIKDSQNLDKAHLSGLKPNGIPKVLKGTSFPFFYNDTKSLISLVEKYKGKIGGIIIESIRNKPPTSDFISTLNNITSMNNIPFIIDEVSAGWRMTEGGAHKLYGINPDIAVFAKGMSNGYPMAAVIGKNNIMEASQKSFISSTYWTDRIGPVAAISTINKLIKIDGFSKMKDTGKQIKNVWENLKKKHNLDITIGGIDPIAHFTFNYSNSLVLKTLFTQLMLKKNILATTAFYASCSHSDNDIRLYENATDNAFKIIKKSIVDNSSEKLLDGPVCHAKFQRLT